MIIKRRSPLTGQINSMSLDITEQQLERWSKGDALIQEAFPNLNQVQREFILTGYTDEDWSTMFGGDEDEG